MSARSGRPSQRINSEAPSSDNCEGLHLLTYHSMEPTNKERDFLETLRNALIEATNGCNIQESADGKEWPCGTCTCSLLSNLLPRTAAEYSEHNELVDRVNEVCAQFSKCAISLRSNGNLPAIRLHYQPNNLIMGIDIYARWRGQTKAEADAQITGWSVVDGHVGDLREAYHGGPYVTKYLVAEAFEAKEHEAAIPANVLRSRLPVAILMHLYREHKLYGNGRDPGAVTSMAALGRSIAKVFAKEIPDVSHTTFAASLKPQSIETAKALIEGGVLSDTTKAFVDFVELCERKETETGEPCIITASA